jgi:hypothetical protein
LNQALSELPDGPARESVARLLAPRLLPRQREAVEVPEAGTEA